MRFDPACHCDVVPTLEAVCMPRGLNCIVHLCPWRRDWNTEFPSPHVIWRGLEH
ncbi:unnamed protein product [Staurois parvus]|uniref:Uncharacterized protein n=1 Tax=Staurois parvus TaxID=386267 RepID=A0ABN9AWE6_9NEOB|nr:unnamed protein product [Staurois parvus]